MTAFLTTVIGSLPRPVWLQPQSSLNQSLHGGGTGWALSGDALRAAQDDAVRLSIYDQERAGIDILSDGEQRRKSWMTYVTSRLGGFDYETLGKKWTRNNRRLAEVGRCVGPVQRLGPIVVDDLKFLMAETKKPVRVTLPGPMSVVDSTLDLHYNDERAFAMALAAALNEEARALDQLGPAVIQFDEPAFSRYPEKVKDWGIAALDRCVVGLRAKTAVHVCYSYPIPGVPRPIVDSYPVMLAALEHSKVDQLCLEFEASGLAPELLRLCPSKVVLFGCISNGTSEVESAEHVAARLLAAAKYLPAAQIQAAPDCGLLPLAPDVSRAKLASMVAGAHLARAKLGRAA